LGLYLGIRPHGGSYLGPFLLGPDGVSALLAGIVPIDVGEKATTVDRIHNIVGNILSFWLPYRGNPFVFAYG